jgi:hypothetical protein
MKNLKKLSRTELKGTLGGKLQTGVPRRALLVIVMAILKYVFTP